jgi:pilus assembly protein CpaC
MHRTNPMLRIVVGLILAGLVLASRTFAAPQPAAQLPAAQPVALQPPPPPPPPGDQAAPVPRVAQQIIVPLGITRTLEMRGKKQLKAVRGDNEAVLDIKLDRPDAPNENPRRVLLAGRSVGRAHLELTAIDDSVETFDVSVEFDVEYLRTLLHRVAPQANLSVTGVGGAGALTAVVIEGNAGPSENINLIMRTAESMLAPGRVINAMHVDGVMQVQLDVVIASVNRTKSRQMSFDLWNIGQHHTLSNQIGGAISVPTNSISGVLPGLPTITNTLLNPNGVPANLTLGLYQNNQWLFAFLQVLKNENLAKLLAEPRLVTVSGRAANFVSGGEQAVPSPGGLGAVSVQFVPFGTRLTFLPYVLNNGKIFLEVEPEVSNLSQAGGLTTGGVSVQGRQIQRVHTSVEMEDGQTFVIGGLVQHRVDGSVNKVPVLGDLPFVGAAFSSKTYREEEDELIVMVTPHLVDPMSCSQVAKVLPGQETRSVDDFELFLEGILEAPRGPRDVNVHGRYVPAFKHSPTAETFPCGPNGDGSCGNQGCNGAGLADTPAIGYPKLAPGGDLPERMEKIGDDKGAELLPPTDVPGASEEAGKAGTEAQR